jgi:hypothetical protein
MKYFKNFCANYGLEKKSETIMKIVELYIIYRSFKAVELKQKYREIRFKYRHIYTEINLI